jgi:hypothetical protein
VNASVFAIHGAHRSAFIVLSFALVLLACAQDSAVSHDEQNHEVVADDASPDAPSSDPQSDAHVTPHGDAHVPEGESDGSASDGSLPSADAEADAAQPPAQVPGCGPETIALTQGWALASSAAVTAQGPEISRAGFSTAGWHQTSVPKTVLAALVADGTYPDPRVMDNHDRIPRAPFDSSWWYRHELMVPADFAGQARGCQLSRERVAQR